jgi:hypothetical protein
MSPQTSTRVWKLPPLILHPFADQHGPSKLLESSRASLMIQGFLPKSEVSAPELDRILLEGRMCEIRMLYYVGKDLLRWMEQCVEVVSRDKEMAAAGLHTHSFANLLIQNTPAVVREKLTRWGVVDYRSIFSRGLALNVLFAEVPQQESLGPDFIRHYYRYADQVYLCHSQVVQSLELDPKQFEFDLFASGEYSRMLEREWQEG